MQETKENVFFYLFVFMYSFYYYYFLYFFYLIYLFIFALLPLHMVALIIFTHLCISVRIPF